MPDNRFYLARAQYNQHGFQSVLMVSRATGVTHSLIEDLERGPRNAGYKSIAKLALHYGVSSDYLLNLSDSPRSTGEVHTAEVDFGLSPRAASELVTLHANYQPRIDALSVLLEQDEFRSILDAITHCVHFSEYPTPFTQALQKHGELPPKPGKKNVTYNEIVAKKDREVYRTSAIYAPQYLMGKISERLVRRSEMKLKRKEAANSGIDS